MRSKQGAFWAEPAKRAKYKPPAIYKYDWNECKIKYEYMAEAVKKFRIYQLLAFFD